MQKPPPPLSLRSASLPKIRLTRTTKGGSGGPGEGLAGRRGSKGRTVLVSLRADAESQALLTWVLVNVAAAWDHADQGAMLAVYEGFRNLSYEFVGCKVLHEEAAHRVCCPCREQRHCGFRPFLLAMWCQTFSLCLKLCQSEALSRLKPILNSRLLYFVIYIDSSFAQAPQCFQVMSDSGRLASR